MAGWQLMRNVQDILLLFCLEDLSGIRKRVSYDSASKECNIFLLIYFDFVSSFVCYCSAGCYIRLDEVSQKGKPTSPPFIEIRCRFFDSERNVSVCMCVCWKTANIKQTHGAVVV